jgi:hypothetical protein
VRESEDSASVLIVEHHTVADKKHMLKMMKDDEAAFLMKGSRIGSRPYFGRTTEAGNRILISAVQILQKAIGCGKEELHLDKAAREVKFRGKLVLTLNKQNGCEWKDLSLKTKATDTGFKS